jgi:hypothetical protein
MTSLPNDDKDIFKKLKSLHAITEEFRKHIEPARNRLLAHLDKEAVLSGKPHGEFDEGEDRRFFDALQELCNITHEACSGTIYGDMILTRSGDVINLRKALKHAIAFDEALSESSDQIRKWLYACLKKTGD